MTEVKEEGEVLHIDNADFDFETGLSIGVGSFRTALNKAVHAGKIERDVAEVIFSAGVDKAEELCLSLAQQFQTQFVPTTGEVAEA